MVRRLVGSEMGIRERRGIRWRGIRRRRCSVGEEIDHRKVVNGVTDRTNQGAYEKEKGLRRWSQ